MTDADAIAFADEVGVWGVCGDDGQPTRTLRDALALAAARSHATLFRPGGFGAQAVWIKFDQIVGLQGQIAQRRLNRVGAGPIIPITEAIGRQGDFNRNGVVRARPQTLCSKEPCRVMVGGDYEPVDDGGRLKSRQILSAQKRPCAGA